MRTPIRMPVRRQAPNPAEGLRLYAVMDADDIGEDITVDGVSLVRFRDLGALVAPADYIRRAPTDDDVAEYVRVIDAFFVTGPLIPAPVGTVFRSVDVLQHWLEIHYATLHKTLSDIERRGSPNPPYEYVRMQLGA